MSVVVIVNSYSHNEPHYTNNPFNADPNFGVASINYDLEMILA